jgi:hypothetical protein
MEGVPFIRSLKERFDREWLIVFLDAGTVDYDTSHQARHLFRLVAMTEVPISVQENEEGFRKAQS